MSSQGIAASHDLPGSAGHGLARRLAAINTERIGLVFTHIYVLGFCGVLLGGFGVQFLNAEMPCPLCVLQRMAMMLCAIGPAYIIQRSRQGEVSAKDFATGYGMAIVAAIAGMAMSTRQIMLHMPAGDPGYGDKVLWFHLYTWGLITFAVAILAAGSFLALSHRLVPGTASLGKLSSASLWLFAGVIAANAIVVFIEEGFHFQLPDDPVRYELLYQLGIKG